MGLDNALLVAGGGEAFSVVWEEVGKTLSASFLVRETQKKSDTDVWKSSNSDVRSIDIIFLFIRYRLKKIIHIYPQHIG